MRIHRIPGIRRVVITTNPGDFSGDNPSSPLKVDEQPTGIRFMKDVPPILHYSSPLCPGCISRNVSRNGTYIRDSDDPIIGKFPSFVRENRKIIFRFLEDTSVNRTNNVAEHHFSMRSDLLKGRFRTDEGLLRTSYWYHRLPTPLPGYQEFHPL